MSFVNQRSLPSFHEPSFIPYPEPVKSIPQLIPILYDSVKHNQQNYP